MLTAFHGYQWKGKKDTVDSLFKVSLMDGLPLTAIDIAGEKIKDSVLSCLYQYQAGHKRV